MSPILLCPYGRRLAKSVTTPARWSPGSGLGGGGVPGSAPVRPYVVLLRDGGYVSSAGYAGRAPLPSSPLSRRRAARRKLLKKSSCVHSFGTCWTSRGSTLRVASSGVSGRSSSPSSEARIGIAKSPSWHEAFYELANIV